MEQLPQGLSEVPGGATSRALACRQGRSIGRSTPSPRLPRKETIHHGQSQNHPAAGARSQLGGGPARRCGAGQVRRPGCAQRRRRRSPADTVGRRRATGARGQGARQRRRCRRGGQRSPGGRSAAGVSQVHDPRLQGRQVPDRPDSARSRRGRERCCQRPEVPSARPPSCPRFAGQRRVQSRQGSGSGEPVRAAGARRHPDGGVQRVPRAVQRRHDGRWHAPRRAGGAAGTREDDAQHGDRPTQPAGQDRGRGGAAGARGGRQCVSPQRHGGAGGGR